MYKVMLVDDEVGVRNSIKAKMNWEAAGFQVNMEASNGEEALRLLRDSPLPELVISDIRMPQMDGITFIQVCKERYPELRIVVLSGYSDFEYMKSAIQLGVKDYLLKPVVRSELSDLMTKISVELEEDRCNKQIRKLDLMKSSQQLEVLQGQMLLQLVKSEWFSLAAVKERLQQLKMSALTVDDLQAQFVTVEMRLPHGRLEQWSDRKDLLNLAFQMMGRETAGKWGDMFYFQDAGHPSMMFFLILLDETKIKGGHTERFVRELKHYLKEYLRLDCVIGIGERIKGLKELKNGYVSSMLSWSQSTIKINTGSGGRTLDLTHAFTPEVERKLINAIESLDMRTFSKQVQDIFTTDRDTPMFAFTFLTFRIILLFNSIAKKFELGDHSLQKYLWNCQMTVRDHESRDQVLEQLHEMAQLVMNEVRKTRFSNGQQLAEAIRMYVEDNYSYELTLSSLAEMFHINETYLSGLFKQNAGITFSDYLTRLRLTKAEQLLKEDELKLTDITTLVGYSSSSYFSTAFKKFYGMSPKEYREKFTQKKTE
ncbi:helix-turn-helix domain-containing protein [Cohnella sp.]|uniref:response regulator transcription factor n=1 Tax=Cohnella sp. TaxID=1883426 RepID=UPI0035616EE7